MAISGSLAIWTQEAFGSTLRDITIGDLLDEQATRRAAHEALVIVDPEAGLDLRWTYAELRTRVDAVAAGLIGLGIEVGDRVAVLAPNGAEWILLEYALAKIGAVMVTVNTAYRRHELQYLLQQGRVRTLFTVAEYRGNPYLETLRSIRQETSFPDLAHVVLIGEGADPAVMSWSEMLRSGDAVPAGVLARRQAAVGPRDIVQIQYTSGTTGAPKGVMLTHRGTVNNANLMGDRAGFTSADRLLAVMPLFHTAGCVCNALGMLAKGGTLVLMVAFDAAKALALIASERITVMNGVPTMYLRLLAEPGVREGRFAASTLRTAFTGGTSIPAIVMQQMKQSFGADPMVIMGMTEASPLITQTLPSDTFEQNTSTAGIALPFTEIKVIDPLTQDTVACGAEGELCIRGYLVTPGYFDMPGRSADAIDAEGWLHSGDLAILDARGYLRIVGRTKDMIIRGGENIYPAEIEDLLMRHPGVEQVQVVGVPDPDFGEEAYAFIVAHDGGTLTEPVLREWCRASFSRHKVPRYMEFIEGFPQTASGKVKKFELRELARTRIAKP